MKEFNPEKEYKALTKSKISEKKVIVATCLITALTVIGYSFANYTAHPADILAVDTKVGEFSKDFNLSEVCDGKTVDACLKDLDESQYGEELANDNTNDKNIRYIGAEPNNYVKFNGEDWRIIGFFNNMWECPEDNESESIDMSNYTNKCTQKTLLKIIRKDFLGNIAWNSSNVNDWSQATLMTLLNNGEYWNKNGSYTETGLNEDAKKMIALTMWNLGGTASYTSANNGLASNWYGYERGTTVYNGRPDKWIGKVGLMYPSDYGFATSGGTTNGYDRAACLAKELYNWNTGSYKANCVDNDWLYNSGYYQWTLSPYTGHSGIALGVYSTGRVNNDLVYNADGVRPVVYLKSTVQITGGHGKSDDPYTLSVTN